MKSTVPKRSSKAPPKKSFDASSIRNFAKSKLVELESGESVGSAVASAAAPAPAPAFYDGLRAMVAAMRERVREAELANEETPRDKSVRFYDAPFLREDGPLGCGSRIPGQPVGRGPIHRSLFPTQRPAQCVAEKERDRASVASAAFVETAVEADRASVSSAASAVVEEAADIAALHPDFASAECCCAAPPLNCLHPVRPDDSVSRLSAAAPAPAAAFAARAPVTVVSLSPIVLSRSEAGAATGAEQREGSARHLAMEAVPVAATRQRSRTPSPGLRPKSTAHTHSRVRRKRSSSSGRATRSTRRSDERLIVAALLEEMARLRLIMQSIYEPTEAPRAVAVDDGRCTASPHGAWSAIHAHRRASRSPSPSPTGTPRPVVVSGAPPVRSTRRLQSDYVRQYSARRSGSPSAAPADATANPAAASRTLDQALLRSITAMLMKSIDDMEEEESSYDTSEKAASRDFTPSTSTFSRRARFMRMRACIGNIFSVIKGETDMAPSTSPEQRQSSVASVGSLHVHGDADDVSHDLVPTSDPACVEISQLPPPSPLLQPTVTPERQFTPNATCIDEDFDPNSGQSTGTVMSRVPAGVHYAPRTLFCATNEAEDGIPAPQELIGAWNDSGAKGVQHSIDRLKVCQVPKVTAFGSVPKPSIPTPFQSPVRVSSPAQRTSAKRSHIPHHVHPTSVEVGRHSPRHRAAVARPGGSCSVSSLAVVTTGAHRSATPIDSRPPWGSSTPRLSPLRTRSQSASRPSAVKTIYSPEDVVPVRRRVETSRRCTRTGSSPAPNPRVRSPKPAPPNCNTPACIVIPPASLAYSARSKSFSPVRPESGSPRQSPIRTPMHNIGTPPRSSREMPRVARALQPNDLGTKSTHPPYRAYSGSIYHAGGEAARSSKSTSGPSAAVIKTATKPRLPGYVPRSGTIASASVNARK